MAINMRLKQKSTVVIVVPAYNEEPVIQSVIQKIQKAGFRKIIVVDDGSTDGTGGIAKKAKALVITHILNRGKGAAIRTGIEAAKFLNASIVITMDGDGQHNSREIDFFIKKIQKGYSVVLGSRFLGKNIMPFRKRVYNYIGNIFTWILFGLWVTDSQSGFRAFSAQACRVIDTNYERYEYDSEVIQEIRRHQLSYCEVPITVQYSSYSQEKENKQSFTNGLQTIFKMLIT